VGTNEEATATKESINRPEFEKTKKSLNGKRAVDKGKGDMPQVAQEETQFLHRPRPKSTTK